MCLLWLNLLVAIGTVEYRDKYGWLHGYDASIMREYLQEWIPQNESG
jgi:hypothetical protein